MSGLVPIYFRRAAILLGVVSSSAFCAACMQAQMVSPAIDVAGEPFSYFSKPTDEIGIMGAEGATEITPEGYLRTGYGELMFFTGPDLAPTSVRIRTLEQNHLPIVHYEMERDGIGYRFTMFEAGLNAGESGPLVNFIRVTMRNKSDLRTRAIFATGIRYDALSTTGEPMGDNRYRRPAEGRNPGDYRQIGEKFSADWKNSFDNGHFYRGGRMLYGFPGSYSSRGFVLRDRFSALNPPELEKPVQLNVEPETPVGIVIYSSMLEPGEEWSLDFKMPLVPTADADAIKQIDLAGLDDAQAQATTYWARILKDGMRIELPEAKAVDTFYTNLIYDLIAIDHIGPDYIQTVNKLHYHAFFLRDGADITHSYDVTGYPQIAKECLEFFAKSQKPDGNFLSQSQQYDGWGEAVWGYSQHYRMTRDKDFAEWALPQIEHAVEWLHKAREVDPLHIVPASDVRDNEYVPGHLTGYNFLALSGLKLAIQMAKETGHTDLAQNWQAEYDSLHEAFMKVLDAQAAAHDGYIPPALDGQTGGYDWGNMLAVDYEPILDPHDPRVTATLKATQAKYAEGIMTYANGEYLHHYLTMKNTLTETIRGDQQQALSEFYAILAHTSSTNAGFEFNIRPWGDRDFGHNLTPHGWFAAEYRALLRAMLVREEGKQLHLLTVVSPAWIGQGKTIKVSQAPTYFGTVAFTLAQPQEGAATLKLNTQFVSTPDSIVVHLPWFVDLHSATVDGKPAQAANGELTVPAATKEIELRWSVKANTPHMSYESAVASYKAEYARRYQALMHGKTGNEGKGE